MKNLLSTAVLAFALALLVPGNGAQAVRLADVTPTAAMRSAAAALDIGLFDDDPVATAAADPGPATTWVLALGILGIIVLRRIRE